MAYLLDKNLLPTPAEVQAEPLSLTHFASWLETMPLEQEYCYRNTANCLIAQYFQAFNIADTVGAWSYRAKGGGPRLDMPAKLNDIAGEVPNTFGGALARTRALLATSP